MRWTKEKCLDEAIKYNIRSDFKKYSSKAYVYALNNKLLDEICSHMTQLRHNKTYWTKEKCIELAKKCNSKTELKKKYYMVHLVSTKNKWLDEICYHMSIKIKENRCIYSYEFEDNSVYIGLTHNLKERMYRHNISGTIFNYIKNNSILPKIKQITEYLPVNEARIKEQEYIESYKNNGWNILNIAKAGSIGSNIVYWTKERCKSVALECKTKHEFDKKFRGAYSSSLKNKWLNEVCSHMENKIKPPFTFDICLKEAIEEKTKNNFTKYHISAYVAAKRNNWLDEICKIMSW